MSKEPVKELRNFIFLVTCVFGVQLLPYVLIILLYILSMISFNELVSFNVNKTDLAPHVYFLILIIGLLIATQLLIKFRRVYPFLFGTVLSIHLFSEILFIVLQIKNIPVFSMLGIVITIILDVIIAGWFIKIIVCSKRRWTNASKRKMRVRPQF